MNITSNTRPKHSFISMAGKPVPMKALPWGKKYAHVRRLEIDYLRNVRAMLAEEAKEGKISANKVQELKAANREIYQLITEWKEVNLACGGSEFVDLPDFAQQIRIETALLAEEQTQLIQEMNAEEMLTQIANKYPDLVVNFLLERIRSTSENDGYLGLLITLAKEAGLVVFKKKQPDTLAVTV